MGKDNSVLYGLFAGIGIVIFYLAVLTIFQDFNFAISNLRSLWYWIFPLAAGFGTQIGLYTSIRHNALVNSEIAGTGGISAGSMVACCSHFLLNIIPLAGFSGLAIFLMNYQKVFFSVGIISNIVGIGILLNHKRKMKNMNLNNGNKKLKGNLKFPIKRETHLKGGSCH